MSQRMDWEGTQFDNAAKKHASEHAKILPSMTSIGTSVKHGEYGKCSCIYYCSRFALT